MRTTIEQPHPPLLARNPRLRTAFFAATLAGAILCPLAARAKAPRPQAAAAIAKTDAVATVAPRPAPVKAEPVIITLSEDPADVTRAAAKIDALVVARLAKAAQQPNPLATDEQFVRRLYLDIAGRIPTATETAEFLDDLSSDKRAKLIDHLLTSEGCNSHTFNWLADMLRVVDDTGKGTKQFLYEEWLKEQIAHNRKWDALVHDLMTASGRLTNSGPVGYLLRDRGMPLDNLSNTLTVFLGANVACAQCHDHPLAQWKQQDFYQMASFFGATDFGYKKGGGVGIKGVGNRKTLAELTGLGKGFIVRLLGPNGADVETLHKNTMTYPKDYKYTNAKPSAPVVPTLMTWTAEDKTNPAFAVDTAKAENLREQFANWLTHPQNPRFATAIANRLWKRTFGIAVQEPVTDLDDLSKGSNPELLADLTTEMKRVKFDLREYRRILFNTQTYQRQVSLTPDPAKGPYLFAGPVLRRMTAEQAWDSVLTLVVGPQLDEFKLNRAYEVTRLNIPGKITQEAVLAKAKEVAAEDAARPHKKGGGGGGKKGAGAEVTPDDFGADPPPKFLGMTLARASELAQPSREAHFLRMFGQSDRQIADDGSTEGGVPQVLMMMNGNVQKVIASRESLVLKHAAAQGTPKEQVKSLYFSFLGRVPAEQESKLACDALKSGMSLGELTWVLFNSREFIFVQ
jgi:hypothetical protein